MQFSKSKAEIEAGDDAMQAPMQQLRLERNKKGSMGTQDASTMAERTRRVLGLLKLNYNIYIYANLILRYVKETKN